MRPAKKHVSILEQKIFIGTGKHTPKMFNPTSPMPKDMIYLIQASNPLNLLSIRSKRPSMVSSMVSKRFSKRANPFSMAAFVSPKPTARRATSYKLVSTRFHGQT